MPKKTYVYKNGKVVEKLPISFKTAKSVHVISDTMEETRHMADGNYYTSKARFRQATRAAGCVEVGSETATLLKPRKPVILDRGQRRDAIRRVIYELRNR